jgi:hypothetical protein
MKRIITGLLMLVVVTLGLTAKTMAQDDVRIERGETRLVREEVGDWVEYDRKTNTTVLKAAEGATHRVRGQIHKVALDREVVANNYDFKTGKPHQQRLPAGTLVWVDDAGNLICKASCKNPLSTPVAHQTTVTQKNTVVLRERERRLYYETDVHHYRDVPVPGPERIVTQNQYVPIIVMGPQQQYIGNLGAPTVLAPVLNGIPGISISKSSFSVAQNGGGAHVGNISAAGGAGGSTGAINNSAYGAAAAAAAAAAASSSSSTSTTPTSAAGASNGGSSGSSGSSGSGGRN